MNVYNSFHLGPIYQFGNDDQKGFIHPFSNGQKIRCFALIELGNDSDAGAASTIAAQKGSDYVLNGAKCRISNQYESEAAIVFPTADKSKNHKGVGAFFTHKPLSGLALRKKEDKLGIRDSSTYTLNFEDCPVSADSILEKRGMRFKIAMMTLDFGRIGIASQAFGIAQVLSDIAVDDTSKRTEFVANILKSQTIQTKVADMTLRLKVQSARLSSLPER